MYGQTIGDPNSFKGVGIDTVNFNGGGQPIITGNVASRLLASGMDVNILRTNATLQKDEWIELDNAVVKAARTRLTIIQDLINLGLVKNLNNGLAMTVLEWQTASDFTAAEVTMDGITRTAGDRPNYELAGVPLPLIHKNFDINSRVLNVSRRFGNSLETDGAERAARVVAEKVEDIFFNGLSSYKFGGYTIYGLCDYTHRNTGSLTAAWSSSSTTGQVIHGDVLSMIDAAEADHYYGPYGLWVPTTYGSALSRDYKTYGTISIKNRILEDDRIKFVRTADGLTTGNVVLAQLTSDVIEVVIGLQPTTVQWEGEGGLINYFKVMCIMIPRIKADQDNNCGVVHFSA